MALLIVVLAAGALAIVGSVTKLASVFERKFPDQPVLPAKLEIRCHAEYYYCKMITDNDDVQLLVWWYGDEE